MNLDFLRSIIINQAWYQKMSKHNNIPDPHDQNHELLAILWDGMKRKVRGNVIFHVVNAGDLKGE